MVEVWYKLFRFFSSCARYLYSVQYHKRPRYERVAHTPLSLKTIIKFMPIQIYSVFVSYVVNFKAVAKCQSKKAASAECVFWRLRSEPYFLFTLVFFPPLGFSFSTTLTSHAERSRFFSIPISFLLIIIYIDIQEFSCFPHIRIWEVKQQIFCLFSFWREAEISSSTWTVIPWFNSFLLVGRYVKSS